MHGITPSRSIRIGTTLKWFMMAAIAMAAVGTMVVTAAVQAQSSEAPNPPVRLTTQTLSSTSVHLAWNPPEANNCQVSQYNVLANEQSANEYDVDVMVPADTHQYTLANLSPATFYEVRVYAHSADAGCPLSSTPAIILAVTKAGPAPQAPADNAQTKTPKGSKGINVPSQPRNVSYDIYHDALVITWDHSTYSGNCRIKSYVVVLAEWDGTPGTEPVRATYQDRQIPYTAGTGMFFEGLKPETKYYTYLAARGDSGCEGHGYSPKVELYFTTEPVPTPPPPPPPTAAPAAAPAPEPTQDPDIESVERKQEIPIRQGAAIYVEVVKGGTVYATANNGPSSFNIAEGSAGVHETPIQVRLTGSPSAEVKVRLKFHKPNDSAVQGRKKAGANRDFHFMYKTLTWAANASGAELTKTVNLKVVGDTRDESNETVKLVVKEIDGTPLSSDDSVAISRNGRQQIVNVVIVDDDGG